MKFQFKGDEIYDGQSEFGEEMFREVIFEDSYRLRDFFRKSRSSEVETIVDIGASVGFFSVMASMLYPKARRIAIEPGPESLQLLQENVAALNVECVQMALGDGSRMEIENAEHWTGSDRCVVSENGSIRSSLLSDILTTLNVSRTGLVLKVDCEGGEKSLIQDKAFLDWIPGCLFVTGEVHTLELWTEWSDWATEAFKGFHLDVRSVGPLYTVSILNGKYRPFYEDEEPQKEKDDIS